MIFWLIWQFSISTLLMFVALFLYMTYQHFVSVKKCRFYKE